MSHVINPLTGRKIKVDGPTYIKLGMSGSRTRGWREASPKRGKEREALKKKCGDTCFLLPEKNKFPICRPNSCEPDCRGILSAKIRARQYKYDRVATIAERMENEFCKPKSPRKLLLKCCGKPKSPRKLLLKCCGN